VRTWAEIFRWPEVHLIRRALPASKVGFQPTTKSRPRRSVRRVNSHDYNSLFAALNQAVEILYRNRTPDPAFVAAYDTLKQSRAMIEQAVTCAVSEAPAAAVELAA
jgi:hypothetical protein